MVVKDSTAQQLSQQLSAILVTQIQQHGRISFAQFMQQALYAPGLGYYSNAGIKFGRAGDFITAPEAGSLFAQCVAQQCAQILSCIRPQVILEVGAGSGQLACDLLVALAKLNVPIEEYLILELSAQLKQRQQQKIMQLCPQYFSKCRWLTQLPSVFTGIILANEVLDAMPVNRFVWQSGMLQEYFVILQENNFSYVVDDASPDLNQMFFAQNIPAYLANTNLPYISEINLLLPGWIKSLATCLQQGAILLFDYGFDRAQYYHPQRNTGTLMCHYQHHCHSNAFFYPGLQDITAHVDFTAVAEAASNNQLNIAGYTNLASFVMNCGIIDLIKDRSLAHECNLLTSPAEMGELFKAMLLTKKTQLDFSDSSIGFNQFDKRHCL